MHIPEYMLNGQFFIAVSLVGKILNSINIGGAPADRVKTPIRIMSHA